MQHTLFHGLLLLLSSCSAFNVALGSTPALGRPATALPRLAASPVAQFGLGGGGKDDEPKGLSRDAEPETVCAREPRTARPCAHGHRLYPHFACSYRCLHACSAP